MVTETFFATAAAVVRFPAERRVPATLALMRELAPDPHDVRVAVAAFDLRGPLVGSRDRVDTTLSNHLPSGPRHVVAMPDASNTRLGRVVASAIRACWSARDMTAAAGEAQGQWVAARKTGQGWLERLRARAETLRRQAAELLVEAHARVEVAEHVARETGLVACDGTGTGISPGTSGPPVAALVGPIGQSGFKATVRARVALTPTPKRVNRTGAVVGGLTRSC